MTVRAPRLSQKHKGRSFAADDGGGIVSLITRHTCQSITATTISIMTASTPTPHGITIHAELAQTGRALISLLKNACEAVGNRKKARVSRSFFHRAGGHIRMTSVEGKGTQVDFMLPAPPTTATPGKA